MKLYNNVKRRMLNTPALTPSLQKVVGCASGHVWLSTSWGWVKLQEWVLEGIVQLHDWCLVSTSVAIIGCWEDCDHVSIMWPIVSLHNQLMCPWNQGQPVWMVECLGYILSKGISCSSWRDSPASSVIRIRPKKIAHGAFMRNLLQPVECSDVVQSINTRRESSMKTENLTVN